MSRALKKRKRQPARESLIGYAVEIQNSALEVEFFGSPHEVVEQIRAGGLAPATLGAHQQTELTYHEVLKDQPEMAASGSRAVAVLTLLDVLYQGDMKRAASILRDRPEILTSVDGGSNIPLLAAASTGLSDAVELLIANRARVDGTTQFDMTALHWAAVKGHSDIAARLLDAGADGKRLSWFYLKPDELAVINGHAETARLIESRTGTRPDAFSMDRVAMRMGLVGDGQRH